jgi:sporulation protein YunB
MRRHAAFLLVTVFVLMLFFLYSHFVVNPVVINYSKSEIYAMAVNSVNAGISDVLQMNTYSEITDVRRDGSGKITSINVDMVKMNKLSSLVGDKAGEYLTAKSKTGIAVPIGTFSGMPLLAGVGFPINLNIDPVGSINSRFDSSFISGGYNQTRHRIVLYFDTVVNVVLPLSHHKITVAVEMPLCESIIIGEVPRILLTQ